MHVPMSQQEIARFLEIPKSKVVRASRNGRLKRTIYHSERPNSSLAHSSIFDVLEYAVAEGQLSIQTSREQAALWITYLCEACEWDEWESWDIFERAAQILAYSTQEGLCAPYNDRSARIATLIVITQAALMDFCLRNDAADSAQLYA